VLVRVVVAVGFEGTVEVKVLVRVEVSVGVGTPGKVGFLRQAQGRPIPSANQTVMTNRIHGFI